MYEQRRLGQRCEPLVVRTEHGGRHSQRLLDSFDKTKLNFASNVIFKREHPKKAFTRQSRTSVLPTRQYIGAHCVKCSLEDVGGDSRVQQVME